MGVAKKGEKKGEEKEQEKEKEAQHGDEDLSCVGW